MKKDKQTRDKKEQDKKPPIVPDNGQGSAGDFGSDGDMSSDKASGTDDKSKKDTQQGSPVPVKRQD